MQNAEYFGCYQREWVLSPAQVLPEDATKKFVNIDWTLGNTVNENPNALSIVPNKGVVPSRTGLVLLNFGLSVNVTQGTNVYDLVCQVFRRNAAGQDVLVRTGTFRLYEGQINADLFNLVILLPMQEGDGVWFRILVPTVFRDFGYVASLSGTVFPSVIDQTANTYVRRAQAGIDPGDTPVWGAWTTLNAPRPQAADGVGQWKNIELNASSYTLPQGHTWACQILGLRGSDGRIVVTQAGVYAGGTVFDWSSANVSTIIGFAWRVAQ